MKQGGITARHITFLLRQRHEWKLRIMWLILSFSLSLYCVRNLRTVQKIWCMYFLRLMIFIRASITFAKLDIQRYRFSLQVSEYQLRFFVPKWEATYALRGDKKPVLIYGPYRLANLTCVSHAAAQVVPSLSFLRPSHSHYTNDISLTYGLPERRYFGRSHEDFFRNWTGSEDVSWKSGMQLEKYFKFCWSVFNKINFELWYLATWTTA